MFADSDACDEAMSEECPSYSTLSLPLDVNEPTGVKDEMTEEVRGEGSTVSDQRRDLPRYRRLEPRPDEIKEEVTLAASGTDGSRARSELAI